jgi:hypothetical protein
MTLRETAKGFWYGQGIYFVHVIALITPGVEATQYEAHPIEPKSLDGWSSWDRALMIEEGRRQADRQLTDLKEVRGRAQWLFTVGIAVTAAIGGALRADRPTDGRLVLFIASLLMLVCGLAGAAGIMTVRADFNTIDTAVLSHKPLPTERYLAGAYSRMLRDGENTIATRITIFRQAVVWIIAGGYVGLVATLI